MPSSHAATQRTSDTRTNAGVPQVGPRENLRSLVIKLSRASRQEGLSSSTAGELREAAHALNLADPRFWGGGHGVPADELADLMAAAIAVQAKRHAGRESAKYIMAGYRHLRSTFAPSPSRPDPVTTH